jgi:CheY-like chemotaxis protein
VTGRAARPPRVVIADDHDTMRARIAALLASQFDLVAAVADGEQAVEVTASLTPDVIVLDVSMPVLGGIEAAARIRKLTRVPGIVFLTAHDEAEVAPIALALGARLVSKRRMMIELVPTVRRALSVAPGGAGVAGDPASDRYHAVCFHDDERVLAAAIASFIGKALTADEAALMVATPSHTAAAMARLARMGVDPSRCIERGELVVLDARETLSFLTAGGEMPSIRRFDDMVPPLMEALAARCGQQRVTVYGEMVDLLWADGREAAALSLEAYWNEVRTAIEVSVLCGYSTERIGDDAAYEAICDCHRHLRSGESDFRLC